MLISLQVVHRQNKVAVIKKYWLSSAIMCRSNSVWVEKDIDGMPELPATPPGHDVPCISSNHPHAPDFNSGKQTEMACKWDNYISDRWPFLPPIRYHLMHMLHTDIIIAIQGGHVFSNIWSRQTNLFFYQLLLFFCLHYFINQCIHHYSTPVQTFVTSEQQLH